MLASLGAANFKLDALRRSIREIRDAGVSVFNVNLFTISEKTTDEGIAPSPKLRDLVLGYHDELNLGGLPELENIYGPTWDQLAVLVEEKVPVISFHFGVSADLVEFAKSNGARVLCSATTVREAIELEAAGVDVVIAQGFEAGGHRGSFCLLTCLPMLVYLPWYLKWLIRYLSRWLQQGDHGCPWSYRGVATRRVWGTNGDSVLNLRRVFSFPGVEKTT